MRKRIALCMAALVLALLGPGMALVVSRSFSLTMERERARALGEEAAIARAVALETASNRLDRYEASTLQKRYSSKEMAVYLLRDGEPITGEALPEAEKLPELLNTAARATLLDRPSERLLIAHALGDGVLLLAALLLLGALSGCGSVLDALEDRLEATPEPEPSLPTGDYLTEGLYFYGSWRADTDYSDMYAYSDLDYFRSLGEELLSVAASGPDEEALYDACFAFTDEFYYIRTASDLRDLEYYRDPSDEAASAARAEAYEALKKANIMLGSVGGYAAGVPVERGVQLSTRSVMGVELPTLKLNTTSPLGLYYDLESTNGTIDVAYLKFNEVKTLTVELAEVETSVIRLAEAIQKTQKRANALGNVQIPQMQKTIKSIDEVLSEREREEFSRLKVIKAQKEKEEA